jgi:hypothetical protein
MPVVARRSEGSVLSRSASSRNSVEAKQVWHLLLDFVLRVDRGAIARVIEGDRRAPAALLP